MVKFSSKFIENLQSTIENFIKNGEKLSEINQYFKIRTNLSNFFADKQKINEFENFLKYRLLLLNPEDLNIESEIGVDKFNDLGDFQTSKSLTDRICQIFVDKNSDFKPEILIEPTCGTGNFILSALKLIKSIKLVYCVEIQQKYEWIFKLKLLKLHEEIKFKADILFYRDNIFHHDIIKNLNSVLLNVNPSKKHSKEVIILGNPPWITNSELSTIKSENLPNKTNIKHFSGIDSITGKSNFDISESIITQILQNFVGGGYFGKIAMLCKNIVVRNLVKDNQFLSLHISHIKSLQIDSKHEFDVNVSSSLFMADFGIKNFSGKSCSLSSFDKFSKKIIDEKQVVFGWFKKKFVSNIKMYKKYHKYDGKFPFTWRQGVKHDLTKIMVLKKKKGFYINGFNNVVDIESKYVYPLLKSSDLKGSVVKLCRYHVIIPQKRVGMPTDNLKEDSPKLWKYLNNHMEKFNNRGSNIYKNKPPFSIFGIGDYSFKPYKIAVSGFYKKLNFSFVPPISCKSVMLDDTCYLISFNNRNDAILTYLILNLTQVESFYRSIAFLDGKRPFTKKILMRFDLEKFLKDIFFRFNQISNIFHSQRTLFPKFDLNIQLLEKYIDNYISSNH